MRGRRARRGIGCKRRLGFEMDDWFQLEGCFCGYVGVGAIGE